MAAYQPRHYQSNKTPRYRGGGSSAKNTAASVKSPLPHMLFLPALLLYLESEEPLLEARRPLIE